MGIVEYKSLNIGYCHWFVTWEGPTISSNYSPQSLWCDLVFPRLAIGSRADRGKHWSVTSVLVSMIWSRKDIYVVRFCCVRIKPGFRPLIWLPEFTRLSKCPIVQMKCVLFHVVFFKYFVLSRVPTDQGIQGNQGKFWRLFPVREIREKQGFFSQNQGKKFQIREIFSLSFSNLLNL